MYLKKYEIRWNDVDANGHLGNSAYMNYCSNTRVRFLEENGFGFYELNKKGISPVLLNEQFSYFKEFLPHEKVYISFALNKVTPDGTFYEFQHGIFKENGVEAARAKITGCWLDLNSRKIVAPPPKLFDVVDKMPKTEAYKICKKSEILNLIRPRKIDISDYHIAT